MSKRTTILLDDKARRAARELAMRFDCSTSEAIRRAILRYRDSVLGIPVASREERKRLLERLYDLFEGHDADEEVRQLKLQDEGF